MRSEIVIPGRGRQPANPESILPVGGYGFQARRYAASRNDDTEV